MESNEEGRREISFYLLWLVSKLMDNFCYALSCQPPPQWMLSYAKTIFITYVSLFCSTLWLPLLVEILWCTTKLLLPFVNVSLVKKSSCTVIDMC
jgi:hypothetical protein